MPSDENPIILALWAIEKDPILTLRVAARVYSVRHSTLIRRKHGRPARGDCQPKSHKLTDLKKKTIVEYVFDLDSQAFPPRIQEVEDMANRFLEDCNATPSGKRWASNDNHSSKHVFFGDTITRQPNANIQRSFVAGLPRYAT